ncbi:MAG TPA: tryptophan-rich sensory protein [Bryobacteraceae bacterium]|nr:tryptophan-rich sensory protein [Bryobacteraceae bacterium]
MQYLITPLIAVATGGVCALLARSGMPWFRTLRVPQWPIPARALAVIWAVLLAMGAVSAILAWNATPAEAHSQLAAVYLVNAFLHPAWCYMLFVRHQIGSATLDAALMAIGTAVIVLDVYPASMAAALLVLPLFLWVLFGMYLSFAIFRMNVRGGPAEG